MREAYIRRVSRCQAAVPASSNAKTAQSDGLRMMGVQMTGCKNANDHEQQARVHPALPTIPWSSQRRSFQASTSPYTFKIGTDRTICKGSPTLVPLISLLIRHVPDHRAPRGGRGRHCRRRLTDGRRPWRLAELPGADRTAPPSRAPPPPRSSPRYSRPTRRHTVTRTLIVPTDDYHGNSGGGKAAGIGFACGERTCVNASRGRGVRLVFLVSRSIRLPRRGIRIRKVKASQHARV